MKSYFHKVAKYFMHLFFSKPFSPILQLVRIGSFGFLYRKHDVCGSKYKNPLDILRLKVCFLLGAVFNFKLVLQHTMIGCGSVPGEGCSLIQGLAT